MQRYLFFGLLLFSDAVACTSIMGSNLGSDTSPCNVGNCMSASATALGLSPNAVLFNLQQQSTSSLIVGIFNDPNACAELTSSTDFYSYPVTLTLTGGSENIVVDAYPKSGDSNYTLLGIIPINSNPVSSSMVLESISSVRASGSYTITSQGNNGILGVNPSNEFTIAGHFEATPCAALCTSKLLNINATCP